MALDGQPAGELPVADRVRQDAVAAVAALREATGAEPQLLTADNPRAAAALAQQAGIGEVRAGLLPEGKVAAVRERQDAGRTVPAVGDGQNDAPLLTTAAWAPRSPASAPTWPCRAPTWS